jgi:hypothetical protein
MSSDEVDRLSASLPKGVRVQIRNNFDGAWAPGFQVFAAQPGGCYLVRRLSDRSVLPIIFAETELRLDPVPLSAGSRSGWPPPTVA